MRKASAILFFIKLLKIPVSLYSYSLIAHLFGVSLAKDQWLLAYSIVIVLDLAIWGPINEIFRVKFITIKEKMGERMAIKQAQSLLFFIFLFSSLIVAFVLLKPDFISNLLVSDYSDMQRDGLNAMIQIVAPILLINQATLIGISILNAYEIFYIPELATFFSQILSIIILLLTADLLGIYSLVLSTVLGLIILLLFVIIKIRTKGINLFNLFTPKFQDFKQYFTFALPLFIPYFIGQINSLVEKRLISSQGVGSISVIDFAKKFPDMINALVSSVLLTILIPVLAKAFVQKDQVNFSKNFIETFSLGILGLGFFVLFMFFGSSDLMHFFYGNSDINQENMMKIVKLNIFYSFAIFAIFIYLIFSMCLLATGKNRRSAFAGSVAQLLVIFSNIFFINKYGIIVFPISVFVAHLFCGIYMFSYYPYSKKDIVKIFFKNIALILIVLLIMELVLPLILNLHIFDYQIFRLGLLGVLQFIVFCIVGYVLKIEEFRTLKDFFQKKLKLKQ